MCSEAPRAGRGKHSEETAACRKGHCPWTQGHLLGPCWTPCSQGRSRPAACPPTMVSGGRRWHRQGPWCWSTHSALAGSGAGALAGFPGRKELSVCGQAANKVMVWGRERERERGLDQPQPLGSSDCPHCTLEQSSLAPSRAMKSDHPLTSRSPTTKVTGSSTSAG